MKHNEVIKFGGMEIHYCLDAQDTKGTSTLFKCVIGAGAKIAAAHYHESFDETVYGLKGVATYTVDGKTIELSAGDSLFIPRGTVHAFANKSDQAIEFLCYITPGLLGPDYFKDIADIINAGGPPDMTKLKQAMLHHGLVPVAG